MNAEKLFTRIIIENRYSSLHLIYISTSWQRDIWCFRLWKNLHFKDIKLKFLQLCFTLIMQVNNYIQLKLIMLIMFIHVRKRKVWRKVSFYVRHFFSFKTTSCKTLSDIQEWESCIGLKQESSFSLFLDRTNMNEY